MPRDRVRGQAGAEIRPVAVLTDAFEQQRQAISMRLNEMPHYLLQPHHYRRTRGAVTAGRAVAPLVGTRQLVQLARARENAPVFLDFGI